MNEKELFEILKHDINHIFYSRDKWTLMTIYGNKFRGKTYLEVLENANNYAKDNNGF